MFGFGLFKYVFLAHTLFSTDPKLQYLVRWARLEGQVCELHDAMKKAGGAAEKRVSSQQLVA